MSVKQPTSDRQQPDKGSASSTEPPEPSAGSQSGSDVPPPLTARSGFWVIMGWAAVLGLCIALAALVFLALLKGGTDLWYTEPKNPGWFDGPVWWVAVTAGAGLLVGLLRRFFRLPVNQPGTIVEMKEGRVEPSTVLPSVVVSLVTLVGGASLGPEAALGKMGGGLGTLVSERLKLGERVREANTLSGMAAAFGALLSAPYVAVVIILEVARPKVGRLSDTLIATLLAATVGFAVYFPIAGSTFVGLYRVPSFTYHDWQLAAAIPLGLLAAVLALVTAIALGLMKKLTAPLTEHTILRSTIGGIVFGLVAVALPLTLFTGTDQLKTVLQDGAVLGAGLLIAVVFAKILVFALCPATGFIGGPFFPLVMVGGTAGVAVHDLIPGLPLALTFSAMLAALPGALVAVPFGLLLLSILITQIGTLQSAPVAVAVLTAYLALSGTGTLMALINKGKQAASSDAQPPSQPAPSTAATGA